MKKFFSLIIFVLFISSLFAQSDDDLFGGSSSDDDLFADEGIVSVSSKPANGIIDKLRSGVLYETGSIKIGGTFDLSLTTITSFKQTEKYNDKYFFIKNNNSLTTDEKDFILDYDFPRSFQTALSQTLLVPKADAQFTIDAHPLENLRLYTKFGIKYPYITESTSTLMSSNFSGMNLIISGTSDLWVNLFYVKELFADFNLTKNTAMRFGKQTVTWGVGYFFSPADVINLTAIDPENPTTQVEGPLALRTQIVFPGTQNAFWGYIIPDNEFANVANVGFGAYLTKTALAAKFEFVIKGWEVGVGAWYRYQKSPRGILTFTGTIFNKIGIFGECVLAYGKDDELNNQWVDYYSGKRDFIWQATIGANYTWSKPKISFYAQYYYNQAKNYYYQSSTLTENKQTFGHNLAAMIYFEKIFITDLKGQIYGNMNFTSGDGTAFASLIYSPIKEVSITAGPYLLWEEFKQPTIAARFIFSFGSGKF